MNKPFFLPILQSDLLYMAMNLKAGLILAVSLLSAQHVAAQHVLEIYSPDSSLHARVYRSQEGNLLYTLRVGGETIVEPTGLGISVDGVTLGSRITQLEEADSPQSAGTFFREKVVHVADSNGGLQLVLRMFNDGFAYRYVLPGGHARHVQGELSSFRLPAETKVWFFERNNSYKLKSYAGEWISADIDDMVSISSQGPVQGKPLVAQLPQGGYAVITEAALYDYSGMRLRATGGRTFVADFTEGEAGFSTDKPETPWRVVLWANTLQELVNNQVIYHLNPPPDETLFPDRSYIRPGRSVWSWLTRDSSYMRPEKEREFIDHAALLNFEYTLIDEGWERIWVDKWEQLRELCAYARQKQVGVWVWKHSAHLRDPVARDNFLDSVAQAGVVGVKTDFMDSEAKELVDFEIDFLRACAARRLMVNFHGCHAPTGESRTFPNELTREGVRGLELNIHSEGPITPAHNAALPFTRFVIGHGDYTPGLFSKPGGATWGHQLAGLYLFNSPLLCLAENPAFIINDENLAQLVPWLRELPVVWDETRVLPGNEIGKQAIIARRKGPTWYIAAINGEERTKRIPINLDFIGDRQHEIELMADKKGEAKYLQRLTFDGIATFPKEIAIEPNGGFVLRITKRVH